uniref:FBA_2 domain-containing protein n=1 Tax=Steinernema glaseri TaxID=37863 RepID=A0A1I7Z101_9BILA
MVLFLHVPVDFQWIDSVISKWKKGNGFYVYGKERGFFFAWKSDQDWDEFEKEYDFPQYHNCVDITHWSDILTLRVTKLEKSFEIQVMQEWFTTSKVMSLISDWREGNGETLLNGLTEIEVQVENLSGDLTKLLDGSVVEYVHPNKNARCVIALQATPMRIFSGYRSRTVRISICPSDPQPI